MAADTPWTYTFCDVLSGDEIATLPMSGVSMDSKLRDVGQLTGVVPTVDPAVRALDPWAATSPRRTRLFVEFEGTPVWGGRVMIRDREPGTFGLKIGAMTEESWLATTYLRGDAEARSGHGAPTTLGGLVATAQSYPNANIGLATTAVREGPETAVFGQMYAATDVKPLVDYFKGWESRWGQPIEWRIDVAPDGDGRYSLVLLIHEGTFADDRDPWTLHYPGDLLDWSDGEDGTTQANVIVGAAAGATVGDQQTKIFSVATADQVGSDEFAAGYPVQMGAYSVGGTGVHQEVLDAAVQRRLIDRLVQGATLGGVTVRATGDAILNRLVGDPVNLEITHPSYREWPKPARFDGYRITGKKVTVGGAGRADAVSFDLVPPGRLPASISFTAQFRDLLARVRRLEVQTEEL